MSAAPDPSELAPSRDPAAYGRRPLLTASFLAWMSLCGLCLFAGAAIGRFGVQLSPAVKPEAAPAETPGRVVASIPSPPAAPAPAAVGAAEPGPGPASVSELSDRVARLEAASVRAGAAAEAALAAAELSEAAQSSAPFDQDVAAYQRLMPASPDLNALGPLSVRGARSRAALAAALPDLASEASAAAHHPAKDASLLSRLTAMVGRVVIIRRVDPRGTGVDGVLARAEAEAAADNLDGAAAALKTLPPRARAPLDDWIAEAQRRTEIDRRIEAIRAQALAELVQSGGARP